MKATIAKASIAVALILWLSALAGAAWADEPLHLRKLNYIENVVPITGEGCGAEVIAWDRAGFDSAEVYRRGGEIHLKMFATYVHPPVRIFSKLKNSCITRAAVHQINKQYVKVVMTIDPAYQGDREPHLIKSEKGLRVYLGAVPASVLPPAKPEPVAETEPTQAPPEMSSEAAINLAALLAETEPPKDEAASETVEAAAATEPADEALSGQSAINWTATAGKVLAALCISLGILFLLVALAKRLRLPSKLTGGRQGLIRVVQTGMLDMKRRIAVVDVAGELIVVALSGNDVTMLTKIESEQARRRILNLEDSPASEAAPSEPAFIAEPQPTETAPEENESSFGERLRAYSRHAPTTDEVVQHENLRAITERVKELKRL